MDTPAPDNDCSVFESFPEYHNFPVAWDLSEIESPSRVHVAGPSLSAGRDGFSASELMPAGDSETLFGRDPFPKLRTFPVYWDMPR
jgi:hypothetical protein